MANSYTSTGTSSNLTRLELEQLRKADFFSGGKALTKGDASVLPNEAFAGIGNISTEQFSTGPQVVLSDVYLTTPPATPGTGLTTLTQVKVGGAASETVQWYGAQQIRTGSGYATNGTTWEDLSADFVTAGVTAGDLLLVKARGSSPNLNANCVAVISARTTTTLTVSTINNPGNPGSLTNFSTAYTYVIVRKAAVKLLALPNSGPVGREQAFLMVSPTSTLHSNLAPSLSAINADRVTNLVPPTFGGDPTDSVGNRADSVFASPSPFASLDKLGYRIIFFPDNGSGAPDYGNPISQLNPIIDSTIASGNDQRVTIDYKAGVVRLSCAPRQGDAFKVAGGVDGTSGRLNLYATFWAFDTSLTQNAAQSLYFTNSTASTSNTPSKVVYNTGSSNWTISPNIATDAHTSVAGTSLNLPATADSIISVANLMGSSGQVGSLLTLINNRPKFTDLINPVLEDSSFESIVTPITGSSAEPNFSSTWDFSTNNLATWSISQSTDGNHAQLKSAIALSSDILNFSIIQYPYYTVREAHELYYSIRTKRSVLAEVGSLKLSVVFTLANGSDSSPVDLLTLSLTSGSPDSNFVTSKSSSGTLVPSNAVKIKSVTVSSTGSEWSASSGATLLEVDDIQVWVKSDTYLNASQSGQQDKSTARKIKFLDNNKKLSLVSPMLEGSTSKVTLRRPDKVYSSSSLAPDLAITGRLVLGFDQESGSGVPSGYHAADKPTLDITVNELAHAGVNYPEKRLITRFSKNDSGTLRKVSETYWANNTSLNGDTWTEEKVVGVTWDAAVGRWQRTGSGTQYPTKVTTDNITGGNNSLVCYTSNSSYIADQANFRNSISGYNFDYVSVDDGGGGSLTSSITLTNTLASTYPQIRVGDKVYGFPGAGNVSYVASITSDTIIGLTVPFQNNSPPSDPATISGSGIMFEALDYFSPYGTSTYYKTALGDLVSNELKSSTTSSTYVAMSSGSIDIPSVFVSDTIKIDWSVFSYYLGSGSFGEVVIELLGPLALSQSPTIDGNILARYKVYEVDTSLADPKLISGSALFTAIESGTHRIRFKFRSDNGSSSIVVGSAMDFSSGVNHNMVRNPLIVVLSKANNSPVILG